MQKRILVLTCLVLSIIISSVSAWDFDGTVHYGNGTNVSNANVTFYRYDIAGGMILIGSMNTSTNTDGYFKFTSLPDGINNAFKLAIVKLNSNNIDADFVSKPLPQMTSDMWDMGNSTDYYLVPGATIVIEAYSDTGTSANIKETQFMLKDTKLAYNIDEDHSNYSTRRIIHVPSGRNYSLILYFNRTMPIQYEMNNLSLQPNQKHFNFTFYGISDQQKWVSGFVKKGGLAPNINRLDFIGFLVEPGNTISSYSALPRNMSMWRGPAGCTAGWCTDIVNPATGFYNITLVYPGRPLEVILMFVGHNNTGDSNFIAFQNITVGGASDLTDFNASLHNAAGSALMGFSEVRGAPPGTFEVMAPAVNFSLVDETAAALTKAFVVTTIDYTDMMGKTLTWTSSADDAGSILIPMIGSYGIKSMSVYSAELAPLKTRFTPAELLGPSVPVTVFDFDPGQISGAALTDVFIDVIKNSTECNAPNYPSNCSLIGGRANETVFEMFKIAIGGGAISFVMGRASNGITIIYQNVDLIASGPPDVLFDGNYTETGAAASIQEAWRFGSLGPEIYDKVLMGIPFNPIFDPGKINISIPILYDEDWNVIWNTTANGTAGLVGNLTEYASFNGTLFSGTNCSLTNPSALCYVTQTNSMLWITIPHFSGVGPNIGGSSGAVNFTVAIDALNKTLLTNETIQYRINITSLHTRNITILALNDTFSAAMMRFNRSDIAVTVNLSGNSYWSTILSANLEPNQSKYLYLNMSPLATGLWVNNTVFVTATDSIGAVGNANATESVNISAGIDYIAPVVSLNSPTNNTNTSITTVVFACTANDNSYNISNVTLYHNITGTWGAKLVNSTNTTPHYFTNATTPDGVYVWNCYACDNRSNCAFAEANWTFQVDTTKPTVTGVVANLTKASSIMPIQVNATVTDASVIKNVTANNLPMSLLLGNTYSVITTGAALGCTGSPVANCSIVINATDQLQNFNVSGNTTILIDDVPPYVTSPIVIPGMAKGTSPITINVTVIDNVTISSVTVGNTSVVAMTSIVATMYNLTVIPTALGCPTDGNCTLRFTAVDEFGNTNSSVTANLTTDSTAPTVILNSPVDNHYNTTSGINFSCTATDANIANVSVYINSTGGFARNATNQSTPSGVAVTIRATLGEGSYVWNCYACDNLSNCGFAGANRTINIDNTKPVITNVQNTSIASSSAVITWTTNELANATVMFGLNETDLTTQTSVLTFQTSQSVTLSLSASTNYWFNVTSCDPAGNCNMTGLFNFTTLAAAGGGGGGGGGGLGSYTEYILTGPLSLPSMDRYDKITVRLGPNTYTIRLHDTFNNVATFDFAPGADVEQTEGTTKTYDLNKDGVADVSINLKDIVHDKVSVIFDLVRVVKPLANATVVKTPPKTPSVTPVEPPQGAPDAETTPSGETAGTQPSGTTTTTGQPAKSSAWQKSVPYAIGLLVLAIVAIAIVALVTRKKTRK